MAKQVRRTPFSEGEEVTGFRVLEVIDDGSGVLSGYRYRVLALNCGHEVELSHHTLRARWRRVKNIGTCFKCACSSERAGSKKKAIVERAHQLRTFTKEERACCARFRWANSLWSIPTEGGTWPTYR